MDSTPHQCHRTEFYDARRDTHLLLEVDGEQVVIRATRDSYSAARRACFIRELVAEGFLPDEYQWSNTDSPWAVYGVRWCIDRRWLVLPREVVKRTSRWALRMWLVGTLLWLGMLVGLLFH